MMQTANIVRLIAWLSLVVILSVLFLNTLGTVDLGDAVPSPGDYEEGETSPNYVLGIILIATGLMIAVETVFTRNFPEISNPRSLNTVLGIPSAIVAVLLGISWIFEFGWVINTFGVFLDGVYLSGLIILLYEGGINWIGVD